MKLDDDGLFLPPFLGGRSAQGTETRERTPSGGKGTRILRKGYPLRP